MKILIAEDDPVSRRMLENFLTKWGYDVTTAEDGDEAWRRFEADDYPMVITDWMMPVLDGPGLLRRIRASQKPGYVFTILLTAKSQKEDLVEGMEAGADDFLTKPFDRDELRVRLSAGERIIRLEHHLSETQAALLQNEKLASLGRLAAGVAHEINNPIAYVINNLAVLRRDVRATLSLLNTFDQARAALFQNAPELANQIAHQEEEMDLPYLRKNLDRIFDSSDSGLKRIQTIVENLRDFARLDEAEFKAVDLNTALRSTLETLRHELVRKAIHVETNLQPIPPVECHSGKINQVFHNILLNAIQASSNDSLITLRTRFDQDNAVIVEIEDQGVGIRPEHLPRIFDPFFTTKPVGEGTGLGLFVSYRTVHDHGGSLEVESTPDQGSLVRIRLPLQPPDYAIANS